MSSPCTFARSQEAREKGWISRRHQNPSSRDAAMIAHARAKAATYPEEWRDLELPSDVRAVIPRTKPRAKPVPAKQEPKETPKPETK